MKKHKKLSFPYFLDDNRITICAISGPILKSHHSTYGAALLTYIFITILTELVIFSTKVGRYVKFILFT